MEGRRSRCGSNGGVGAPEPRNAVIKGMLAIFFLRFLEAFDALTKGLL